MRYSRYQPRYYDVLVPSDNSVAAALDHYVEQYRLLDIESKLRSSQYRCANN